MTMRIAPPRTHPQTAAMIELRGVTKTYGPVTALHETFLDVRKGEFLTLLGPSGSGKTTLLNMIAGMTMPSAGQIILDGRDVTAVPPEKRGMGMVFQNYALMPHMSVFDNIAFPLQIRKVPSTLIGASQVAQLARNIGASELQLTGTQMERLNAASVPPPGFTAGLAAPAVRRMIFGNHDVAGWNE